jgi:hypothetical protein
MAKAYSATTVFPAEVCAATRTLWPADSTAQHSTAQHTLPLGPGAGGVTWLLLALLIAVSAAALLLSCPERCKQTVAHKGSCAARRVREVLDKARVSFLQHVVKVCVPK